MTQKMIGRYELMDEGKQGGMGVVYQAIDRERFNRVVAIKMLKFELRLDEDLRTRFEREAAILSTLEHPSIVPVYDYGEQDGQPYLVMRYINGESLAARLSRGPLPLDEVIRVIKQIGAALDYAHTHQKGVIHRDLKPSNILFDQQDNPYLTDFGIARLVESGASLTSTSVIGTPEYMSPEQGRGDPNLDRRTDIYALGVTVYQMLTGEVPFSANTPVAIIFKHLTEPVPDILEKNKDLPPQVQAVLERAMAKQAYVRFSSGLEFAQALEAAAKNQYEGVKGVVPPKPPSNPKSPPKKKRRPGCMVALGLFFGLLLVGSLVIFNTPGVVQQLIALADIGFVPFTAEPSSTIPILSTPTGTPFPETHTPQPTVTPVELTATQSPEPSITPTPMFSIGGADLLAFVANGDIYVTDMQDHVGDPLTSAVGVKLSLQWNPEGDIVYYIQGTCVMYVGLDPITQPSDILFCLRNADSVSGFAISPAGDKVAVSSSQGLYILPYDPEMLDGIGKSIEIGAAAICTIGEEIAGTQPGQVRWSQDGQSIAVLTKLPASGLKGDRIQMIDVSRCAQKPSVMRTVPNNNLNLCEFPSSEASPVIFDFDWDGASLLVFSVKYLRFEDFGLLYQCDLNDQKATLREPITSCCYRDLRWSPNREYLFFNYRKLNAVGLPVPYNIIYGTIGTDQKYQPFAGVQSQIKNEFENLQPAFRPATSP